VARKRAVFDLRLGQLDHRNRLAHQPPQRLILRCRQRLLTARRIEGVPQQDPPKKLRVRRSRDVLDQHSGDRGQRVEQTIPGLRRMAWPFQIDVVTGKLVPRDRGRLLQHGRRKSGRNVEHLTLLGGLPQI
jgi:hypothetical protein